MPFTMGTNKFVFTHTMTDEYFRAHEKYFFDDSKLFSTVKELKNFKCLKGIDAIEKALLWVTDREVGTNFGMDYETNGLWRGDKYENIEAIGVGIATKDVGFYLELRDLDSADFERFKSLYRAFLDKHVENIWVFNINFEMMMTRKILGDWAIYDFKDADIFRIIDGHQNGYSKKYVLDTRFKNAPQYKEIKVNREQYWSLKYTAQHYLKVGSWDNDFEAIESQLDVIFNGFKPKTIHDFLTNPLIGNRIHEWVSEGFITEVELTKTLNALCNSKKVNSEESIVECFPVKSQFLAPEIFSTILGCKTLKDIYEHPYWEDLMDEYPAFMEEFKYWNENPKYTKNRFAIQPTEIVGKYCILDSYYTVMMAEKFIDEDRYTNNPHASSGWATTKTLIDVFAANKCLGAKLDLYGLYKSNTTRMHFKDINDKVMVFTNMVVASGFYQMQINDASVSPHPVEKDLHQVFKTVIENGWDPTDFPRITKNLFKMVYDESKEFRWNDEVAESIMGDLAHELKEIMLDHAPKGFNNPSAFSRSINVHKETGMVLENEWNSQDIPEGFDWRDCLPYHNHKKSVKSSEENLKRLKMSNIYGKSIDDILKLDGLTLVIPVTKDKVTSYEVRKFSFNEAVVIMKKNYFDIKPANELLLGQMTETWKDYKVLLHLYQPREFQHIIDRAKIFIVEDSLQDKVSKFHAYIKNCIETYDQPSLPDWVSAQKYAIEKEMPEELCNPSDDAKNIKVQETAYIAAVISEDLDRLYGLNKGLLDRYMFFMSIDPKMMEEKKSELEKMEVEHLSYTYWTNARSQLSNMHDLLVYGDYGANRVIKEFFTADIDIEDDNAYVKLAQLYKLYKKTAKVNTYADGQLVDSDEEYLGEGADGVPLLSGLTKEQKHNNYAGDNVKMFPRYEIMQKISKRSSSGIHTLPSRNECKQVVDSPPDKFLIYTDISSLELRGVAAIADDDAMNELFDSGKDIKCCVS